MHPIGTATSNVTPGQISSTAAAAGGEVLVDGRSQKLERDNAELKIALKQMAFK